VIRRQFRFRRTERLWHINRRESLCSDVAIVARILLIAAVTVLSATTAHHLSLRNIRRTLFQ